VYIIPSWLLVVGRREPAEVHPVLAADWQNRSAGGDADEGRQPGRGAARRRRAKTSQTVRTSLSLFSRMQPHTPVVNSLHVNSTEHSVTWKHRWSAHLHRRYLQHIVQCAPTDGNVAAVYLSTVPFRVLEILRNKSVFGFQRQQTTWHCLQLLLSADRAANDRYLLAAEPTTANPPHAAAAVDRWDRQTDGRTPDLYVDPALHTMREQCHKDTRSCSRTQCYYAAMMHVVVKPATLTKGSSALSVASSGQFVKFSAPQLNCWTTRNGKERKGRPTVY